MSLSPRIPPFPTISPLIPQHQYILLECIYPPEVPSCLCGKSFKIYNSYKP